MVPEEQEAQALKPVIFPNTVSGAEGWLFVSGLQYPRFLLQAQGT